MSPVKDILDPRFAAVMGDATAQYNLGVKYANGSGVEKDEVEAAGWYLRAADQGHATAQYNLGWMYANGRGVEKDDVEAAKWYRKAAEQGNADAQCYLGWMYGNGRGVEKDDANAVEWYRKAADQGHATAQYNLGVKYANGSGVEKDEVEAAKWYRKAAEQGNADAQCYLGWMYGNGRGVEKDDANAVEWYRKAAEQGNAQAQFNLGVKYATGSGVTKDEVEAVKWYRKAAQQGHKNAKKQLERLNVAVEESVNTDRVSSPQKRSTVKSRVPLVHNPLRSDKPSREPAECKPLLDACTPLVYRYNAFRITGLAVDASTRDIKRRIDDLKAVEEMGYAEDEHTHAFALNPAPSLEHIREAAQRLQDPERRIIEEFFWFWPAEWGKGSSDPALTALKNKDKDTAFKIWWHTLSDDYAPASTVAKHNLAVMYQLVALDSEHVALENDLVPEQHATISKYWHTCFKWWEELTDNETFWSLVTDRIRMHDDQRLTTGFARRMRATFPVAFDRINAMLAMKFAETGKYDLAKKHIAYMNETHQGLDNVDNTISIIIKPLETRINSAVEIAVAASQKDTKTAANCAKELIATTEQPLTIVKSLLDESHSIRSYLFEQVTDACFTCLIAYGNATEDWPTCIALLKQTQSIAITDEAREKIQANIAVAQNNHEQKQLHGICWFCKKNKATASGKLDQQMYGDVTRTPTFNGTHIQWRNITVTVPRCDTCKQAHGKVGGAWTGAVAGAAVGTAIFPVVGSIIGLVAGGLLGRQIDKRMRLPPNVSPESAKGTFPSIKELISKGWSYGDKPS